MKPFKAMWRVNVRMFGGKPAKGGPAAATYVPPPIEKTMLEEVIAAHKPEDFLFGPPKGSEKKMGVHRDYLIPKLASATEFYAKRMRQMYHREARIPASKIYFDSLREREAGDTLEKLHENGEIAAVLGERDEYEELDVVVPWRVPFTIVKAHHGLVRPYILRHNGEEIAVTCNQIHKHFRTQKPVKVEFQRFIPGRPNLLYMPLVHVQEELSLHFQAGCEFISLLDEIKVWSYVEDYPGNVEIDCRYLSPNMPIKIGDVEKMLPDGVFLHKDFQRRRH